jgi:hypothetical protein
MKKKQAWSAMSIKGQKVPRSATQDNRPTKAKPRTSGKGGVGSGSGVPGPGTLGKG